MTAIGTRLLKLKIGAVEYTAEVTKAVVTTAPADASLQTFAAAALGGAVVYTLQFTAKQDSGAAASLWNKVLSAAGTTVACVVNPYGVTTFTATSPGYSGNVVITLPKGDWLGGQADSTVNKAQLFSCEWEFDGVPTLLTTGTF
jgi:hypothetical protein